MIESIYRPEANEGTLRETTCGYNNGPGRWDRIEILKENVGVQVQAQQIKDDLVVFATFFVPGTLSATLKNPTAKFYFFDSKKELSLPVRDAYQVHGVAKRIEDINAPLTGGSSVTERKFLNKDYWYKRYDFDFKIPGQKGEPFYLVLPALEVNGKTIEIPKIRFEPQKAFLMRSINC